MTQYYYEAMFEMRHGQKPIQVSDWVIRKSGEPEPEFPKAPKGAYHMLVTKPIDDVLEARNHLKNLKTSVEALRDALTDDIQHDAQHDLGPLGKMERFEEEHAFDCQVIEDGFRE